MCDDGCFICWKQTYGKDIVKLLCPMDSKRVFPLKGNGKFRISKAIVLEIMDKNGRKKESSWAYYDLGVTTYRKKRILPRMSDRDYQAYWFVFKKHNMKYVVGTGDLKQFELRQINLESDQVFKNVGDENFIMNFFKSTFIDPDQLLKIKEFLNKIALKHLEWELYKDNDRVIESVEYDGTCYYVGDIIEVSDFNDDPHSICAPGIHVYLTKQEAIDHVNELEVLHKVVDI